jgi:hypothetical protein
MKYQCQKLQSTEVNMIQININLGLLFSSF